MSFTRVLAQATVSDLTSAEAWYGTLFGRRSGARPMDGLVEWHLGDGFGVQVWVEPARAGHSSMVLEESDLDDLVARLDETHLEHDSPQDVTASRILVLEDPDGNRIVVSAPSRRRDLSRQHSAPRCGHQDHQPPWRAGGHQDEATEEASYAAPGAHWAKKTSPTAWGPLRRLQRKDHRLPPVSGISGRWLGPHRLRQTDVMRLLWGMGALHAVWVSWW